MIPELKDGNESEGEDGSVAVLTVLALVVGAISGVVVALFIVLLERADRLRDALIVWAHAQGAAGFWLLALACAAAAGPRLRWCAGSRPSRSEAASPTSKPS